MRRYQQSRHVLGSDALLTLVLEDSTPSKATFNLLWQQIDAFEQHFSRFLVSSELSRFNTAAGSKQPVSPEFRTLLATAKAYAEKTGGLYNPFILPALQRAGYKGSWPSPHKGSKQLDYGQRASADWHTITVGDTWARIPADTALDFGGIGKGFLLDRLSETLQTEGIGNYWLSLGGDILCNGADANSDSWYIGIARAEETGKTVAAVKNHGQKLAVATSGTTKRRGANERGTWHHIIDPRTGEPATTNVLTATVCAQDAVTADIAAKCLVISPTAPPPLGVTDYILQTADGTVQKAGNIWE